MSPVNKFCSEELKGGGGEERDIKNRGRGVEGGGGGGFSCSCHLFSMGS